jgi:asparagine synthetase B (glutamine-hydrolysing)
MPSAAICMSPLELACGLVLGVDAPPSARAGDDSPRSALEHAILPGLRRPPCLVSFSGGRDSSLVLAAATHLARRDGLPDPIPVTNRIRGAALADESRWQEALVGHLRLAAWERREHTDDLDTVGPYAQRVLRRHGLLWPFNVHFHLPLLDLAGGGSLLTGIGGDELFGAAERSRLAAVLTGSARPRRADALRAAGVLAPAVLRERVLARRHPVPFPWLRAPAQRAVARALAATEAREPQRVQSRLRFWRGLRSLRIGAASLELLARDADVRLLHPLSDDGVWNAFGRAARPHGFRDRTDGMRRLFGDLLPDDLLTRSDKATFDDAFWTGRAEAFARQWTGNGVPLSVVDPQALQRHWSSPAPRAQSFSLLQAAWLATEARVTSAGPAHRASAGSRREEPASGAGGAAPRAAVSSAGRACPDPEGPVAPRGAA